LPAQRASVIEAFRGGKVKFKSSPKYPADTVDA